MDVNMLPRGTKGEKITHVEYRSIGKYRSATYADLIFCIYNTCNMKSLSCVCCTRAYCRKYNNQKGEKKRNQDEECIQLLARFLSSFHYFSCLIGVRQDN